MPIPSMYNPATAKLITMQLLNTSLRDVRIIQPQRFGDSRGWFAEVFNQSIFSAAGLPTQFVQDNQSFSTKGVLRGLHYQLGQPQGKLVRVLSGHIWDVAVDLRRNSPDFGKWAGFHLKTQSPGRHPAPLDPRRLRPWLPRPLRHRRSPLQNHQPLLPRRRTLHPLERPYPQYRLAPRSPQWHTTFGQPQGRLRQLFSPRPTCRRSVKSITSKNWA